ncbi:hypothetical protein CPB84DRAFT_1690087 [Gymnopilus junonius]|uniref:Nucleotidyltransferase family protein n=1 Tax=Gymnopilus junonius TaxID=109634 RepID=A0A9P5TH60_GYMJU|nr:hypothetical protein CPB84DRAFT_1690087 [Gymnopilus junonius]
MNVASCVISGSAALFMFHPDAFIPNDVDFYVSSSGADKFTTALHARGYREKEEQPMQTLYGKTFALRVGHLYKIGVTGMVNLIITCDANPFNTLVQFHTTLVMNAITSDAVISLYPTTTLSGEGVVTVNTEKTAAAL